ncbi:MAG TPA: acetoin utilization protein AcuC [Clostridia bacterium]|nr:acetoin utilization protein AcuC [Clostridia bacterium]
MAGKPLIVYSPHFTEYKFHEGHPFDPLRLRLWYELLETMEAVSPEDLVFPQPASEEELLLVHTQEYIEAVKMASRGKVPPEPLQFNLGTEDNPIFPNMHQIASLVVGGTLLAARLVMEEKAAHVFNVGGGLHHAMKDRASGFCIYNDAAVAIQWLRRTYDVKVMYIDVDAHHGDGVQWVFYQEPEVMTVSFHETGRYLFPGTGGVLEKGSGEGYGYAVNVPLEPFTEDDSFIEALHKVLPTLMESFRPDIIVSQHGCDTHEYDPLTHLSLTTRGFVEAARLIHQLAHDYCQGRWVVLGGGGYDIWRVVPRSWALLWGEISGRQLPEKIPDAWRLKWTKAAPIPLPEFLHDDPADFPPKPRRDEISEKNRRTVMQALSRPVWSYLF